MKNTILFSLLGLFFISVTAFLTLQNWEKIDRKPQNIKIKIGKLSSDQSDYIRRLKNLIAVQWKELEICQEDFDGQFGWFLEMKTKERREFLKKDDNLLLRQ